MLAKRREAIRKRHSQRWTSIIERLDSAPVALSDRVRGVRKWMNAPDGIVRMRREILK